MEKAVEDLQSWDCAKGLDDLWVISRKNRRSLKGPGPRFASDFSKKRGNFNSIHK